MSFLRFPIPTCHHSSWDLRAPDSSRKCHRLTKPLGQHLLRTQKPLAVSTAFEASKIIVYVMQASHHVAPRRVARQREAYRVGWPVPRCALRSLPRHAHQPRGASLRAAQVRAYDDRAHALLQKKSMLQDYALSPYALACALPTVRTPSGAEIEIEERPAEEQSKHTLLYDVVS